MINENIKSQDLKELATIVQPSARSTRLIGVHQIRVSSYQCLDNQILQKDTSMCNDIWCVCVLEREREREGEGEIYVYPGP